MRQSSQMRYAAIAVCGWLATAALARADDRSPGQILAEIKAIQFPRLDDATRRNPEALDELWGKPWRRKSELIMELYRVAPDHAEIPALMYERWRRSLLRDRAEVMSEIDDVLAHTKNEVLRGHALCRKAIEMIRKLDASRSNANEGDGVRTVIDAFIRAAPKDERGAELLYMYANECYGSPEKQAEIFNRIVLEYPGSRWAKMIEGRMRRPGGVGKPFELDFTDSINGEHVSMSGLRGKVVVIDFWATWCGPCVAELPKLKELYAEYHRKGVEFIGVSLDHPRNGGLDGLKSFVKKNEITWPQYYQGNGWDSEFSTSWGINAIPAVFVVDREGKLFSTDAQGKLETIIPELLAKGIGAGSR